MTKTKQGFLWIAIYLLLVLAPLFLLLLGPTPDGRGFWRELSVAVGFAGLSIMGFQFLLTARFRHAEAPFGIDILYHFHRQITWLGLALILAHVAILAAMNPNLLRFFDLGQAPWRFWHGSLSIYLFLVLIALSLWRRLLRMGYELWRVSHGVLGTLAVVFGMAHILMMNRYVAYPPKRWLWIMLCLGWIGLLVYTRLIKPMVMTGRPYSVSAVKAERNDAWTLTLKPGGHKGFRWRPGQFAWLTLGRTPYAMREHPFTMSSIPASDGSIDFTIKNLGDFTSTIGRTRPGETAYLDGPYGAFAIPDGDSGPCVFIAGGVGITPVMAMLRGLAERGDRRPLLLLYGNETWDNVILREEIEALKGRLNLRVEHVLTSPPEGWQGRRGLIDATMLAEVTREADWHGAHYFICGSDPMMDAVEAALTGLGVPLDRIESERYNFV